jgi:hypothetical protein
MPEEVKPHPNFGCGAEYKNGATIKTAETTNTTVNAASLCANVGKHHFLIAS